MKPKWEGKKKRGSATKRWKETEWQETEWHKDKIRGKTEWHKDKITGKKNEKRQSNKRDRITEKTECIKKYDPEIRKVRLKKTGYKQRWVTNKLKRIDN